ncbi:MAG: HesA/MoeB/ThiF family protein [Salinispira sp.]
MSLHNDQIIRYSRHILLQNVGGKGQERLLNSKVLVIGAGGLGSPISLYLAAAGVGTIGLADADVVDLSNLQRQIAHHTPDVGRSKVDSAGEKIEAINPDVQVIRHNLRLNKDNIREIIRGYDFIVEGTDNFPTKYLVNDACVFENKPFNQGGILRFQGQTMTWTPGSACYRCVYPTPPPAGAVPTCSEAGVLGAIAGILGTIQATEALKYLLNIGELLTNRVLFYDALSMNFRTVAVEHNEHCRISGTNPDITELAEMEQAACTVNLEYADTSENTPALAEEYKEHIHG